MSVNMQPHRPTRKPFSLLRPPRVIRDWGEPAADQVMCAVPRKRKFPERQRLSEALDARRGFKPFTLAEAYDQASFHQPHGEDL
jgi:hypothetical protein